MNGQTEVKQDVFLPNTTIWTRHHHVHRLFTWPGCQLSSFSVFSILNPFFLFPSQLGLRNFSSSSNPLETFAPIDPDSSLVVYLVASHARGHCLCELRQADDESDEGAEGDDQEPEDHTPGLKHQTLSQFTDPAIFLINFNSFSWLPWLIQQVISLSHPTSLIQPS